MTISGKGIIGDKRVNCSDPYVAIFAVDHNNVETSFKTVNGGSCPESISSTHVSKWEYNEHGLKKSKSYSNGTCIVGPCDWISTKINVYIYERVE